MYGAGNSAGLWLFLLMRGVRQNSSPNAGFFGILIGSIWEHILALPLTSLDLINTHIYVGGGRPEAEINRFNGFHLEEFCRAPFNAKVSICDCLGWGGGLDYTGNAQTYE